MKNNRNKYIKVYVYIYIKYHITLYQIVYKINICQYNIHPYLLTLLFLESLLISYSGYRFVV